MDVDDLLRRATAGDQRVRLSRAEITSLLKETSRLRHHVDVLESQLETSRAACRTLNDRLGEWQERHALLLEVLRDWLQITVGPVDATSARDGSRSRAR
jgi:hypothetical protein